MSTPTIRDDVQARAQAQERAERTDELAPLYGAAITTLRAGFRLSAAVLLVGLVWAAVRGESLNREVEPFGEILAALRDGHASGLIDIAILLMMATPVATVVVVTRGFFKLGDRTYALLSLVVLAILSISIALSLFE